APQVGYALTDASEVTFTTRPPPRRAIPPATARVSRKGPRRFTSSTRAKSSHSVSSRSRSGVGPSVLASCTRTSTGPASAAAAPAMRWMSSFTPTSATNPWASPPSARISSTTRDSSSSPRATSTTRAPLRARARPSAAPSPRLPPVTSTDRPRISIPPPHWTVRDRRHRKNKIANPLADGYPLGMAEAWRERLAANIRQLREARGLTQEQMARLSGIPRATWGHLESGGANPTLSVLHKVALALQVPLEELTSAPRAVSRHYPRQALDTHKQGDGTLRKLLPDPIPAVVIDRMEIPAGGRIPGVPHMPGTREYLTCEAGEILLAVAGEQSRLSPGDVVV